MYVYKNIFEKILFCFCIAVIKTDRLPAFLKQVYTMSDTILLFKEDFNQADIVIRDVNKSKKKIIIFK